ncbi:MAG: hypothetical protein OSB69_19765 [Alphaproteobacteria bacterium]|nr:hypothetical protein [Alphaproteobacteria bacterium]
MPETARLTSPFLDALISGTLAVPAIVAGIIQALVSAIEAYFVGRLGTVLLAAMAALNE